MKIGVISDTHGFLDPRVPKLFAGVDHILHAGDVGPHSLLLALEAIAPVTAVLGNTDTWLPLNLTETLDLGGRKFLVHHIVDPRALTDDLKHRLVSERPDAIVFGHTHKVFCETIGSALFFNPGYAGKQRFALARSVAILHCDQRGIRPEFLEL
ncbi:MAG: metallophosphoesterase family protein [Verrucomicrobia bacterium]|nr:metallophosphoesterase family protein [Verrucomicrobiota bacterium]